MKRLLIPFLALAVTACGKNDIVITSEVGEKMIVERDTIFINSTSKDRENDSWDSLISSSKSIASMTSSETFKKDVVMYELLKELDAGPMWTQEFRYLPVHRDRNGKEIVGAEKFISCYSPSLTAEQKETLQQWYKSYSGRTLHDAVARTICKEYAKWEVG